MAQSRNITAKKNNPEKGRKNFKKKIFIWLVKVGLIGSAMFFFLVILVYLGLFGRLPSEKELVKIENHTASIVYSVDGKIMGGYYIQNRQTINNKDVSHWVKDALVATEDSRFFEHKGLDFLSLGRVIVKTILFGDVSQGGGSTISQQLAKNLYPRKKFGFISLLVNKIREVFIASRLETVYSKEDILILYLNTVPFGEDIYGIEAASLRFFNKKSKNLNPAEAATLVGMLAANTAYNPRLYPEASKKRRDVVLNRLAQKENLSDEELLKWLESPIKTDYRRIDRNTGVAPYYREKLRLKVEEILHDKYGDDYNLYTDGLEIYTTIDSRIQNYADNAVVKHMSRLQKDFDAQWGNTSPWYSNPSVFTNAVHQSTRYQGLKKQGFSESEIMKRMEKPARMTLFSAGGEKDVTFSPVDSIKYYLSMLNVGFLVMDSRSGYVLAWVGGINHKVFEYDHVSSKRQVGSTFKPFVYSAALLNGIKPCDFIRNEKRVYEDYDNWSPGNSGDSYEGYYSVKGGLANSVNTIAAELIMKTGVDDVIDLAHEMGINSDIPEYPSIALGTANLSLFEMLRAYSVFPNYGYKVNPITLLKIEDKDGNVLYKREPENSDRLVLDPQVAKQMVKMMEGVVDHGTAKTIRTVYGLDSEIAGKTGTTQDNTDGWFIGYTPTLMAGAWVGNDNPAIKFKTTGLGQGATSALPIFANFLRSLESDPRFMEYTQSSFMPLPGYLAEQLDCEDYLLEDPNETFLERLFGGGDKNKPDSKKPKESNVDESKENKIDRPGLLQKMKELFRKK